MSQYLQTWYCELCSKDGAVLVRDGAGVMEVAYAIEEHHREQSPNCPCPLRKLRVKTPFLEFMEGMPKNWGRLTRLVK